jgi:hypothetical protein
MAYSTASVLSNHRDIAADLATKLNALSIATLHAVAVTKISADHFLAVIIYEEAT